MFGELINFFNWQINSFLLHQSQRTFEVYFLIICSLNNIIQSIHSFFTFQFNFYSSLPLHSPAPSLRCSCRCTRTSCFVLDTTSLCACSYALAASGGACRRTSGSMIASSRTHQHLTCACSRFDSARTIHATRSTGDSKSSFGACIESPSGSSACSSRWWCPTFGRRGLRCSRRPLRRASARCTTR